MPDNAIYELADAVKAVQGYELPVRFTDTTRVATLLSAGHAENALPQSATANINCASSPARRSKARSPR